MPQVTSPGEFYPIFTTGPMAQRVIGTAESGLGSSVPASGQIVSNLILSDGFKAIAAAVTSSQAGALKIQRYIDAAGTIAQGAALSVSLVAATPEVLNNNDGVAFQSFTVTITNTGGSAATLTGLALLLQAN